MQGRQESLVLAKGIREGATKEGDRMWEATRAASLVTGSFGRLICKSRGLRLGGDRSQTGAGLQADSSDVRKSTPKF